MKKLFITILFSILITNGASSQQSNSTTKSFTLCVGPASPLGKFSRTKITDEEAGFAGFGKFASISYNSSLKKNYGYSIRLLAQRNPINRKKMEKELETLKFYDIVFGPPFPPPTYRTFSNWKVEPASWLMVALKAGPYIDLRSKKEDVNFRLHGSLGLCYLAAPEMNAKSVNDTASATIFQSDENGFGALISAGANLQYQLRKAFIFTGIQYMMSTAVEFENIRSVTTTTRGRYGTPEYSAQQSTVTADSKQVFNSFNLVFGIGFKL